MYERFYKLKGRPFQLMPDPRLLFESRNHTRGLSYLIYGVERNEGFVVITGDVGTGKTLLLQTLLNQLQTQHLSIARVAMANVDGDAVLPAVAGAFGVAYKARSKFELLDALVAKLAPNRSRGSLLIVDEAQTCSPEALEELRVISNLQADGQALLQVILIGQTELRSVLSRPSMAHLRQRIVASYHLTPLDADEIAGYIEHRLEKVGWRSGQPSFEQGVYARVHEWAGGIPRRINLIMDRLLLYGYLDERMMLTVEDLEVVIQEFEDEFASDDLALDDAPAPSGTHSAVSTSANTSVTALTDRVAGLERALRRQYGDARADTLLAEHAASAEQRALVDALLRVERLETLLSHAPDASHTPRTDDDAAQPADAETPAEPDASAAPAAEIDDEKLSWSSQSRFSETEDSALTRYFRWGRRYE